MKNIIKIHPTDSLALAIDDLQKGDIVSVDGKDIVLKNDIPSGHKFALIAIYKGDDILKYGTPIGNAIANIAIGDHIHTHNIKTRLSKIEEYKYIPNFAEIAKVEPLFFDGFIRKNGEVGIRNDIWIIPSVGCVNKTAEKLAQFLDKNKPEHIDSVLALTHPYGCSQLGDDHLCTQKLLAALVRHPNAAGVLVVGLGCENNTLDSFKEIIGDYNPNRVKFMITQDETDELERGKELLDELAKYAKKFKREKVSVDKLKIGLKCGASDGFSGVSANPLLGVVSDKLISMGGTSILTEVPEMFGAEHLLMERCPKKQIFDKCVKMINDFKQYFIKHNQVIYENPSPGNKKGGISTLEDKSLGCTQKGGTSPVVDVLEYAEPVKQNGLNLLSSPGNDIVAVTALIASGAHIVLFTTGRGTPLGGSAPTVKISTNTTLSVNKSNWIDFDAGVLLTGVSMNECSDSFMTYLLKVASGEYTCAEKNGYQEISIFKDGIIL